MGIIPIYIANRKPQTEMRLHRTALLAPTVRMVGCPKRDRTLYRHLPPTKPPAMPPLPLPGRDLGLLLRYESRLIGEMT